MKSIRGNIMPDNTQLDLDTALKDLQSKRTKKSKVLEGWSKDGSVYYVDGKPFGVKMVPAGRGEWVIKSGIVDGSDNDNKE